MPTHIILKTRGQVMMLGVLTLLVLAVMMMLTFTVNTAVHEKIRLQSHSDSVAYSTAVIEARAFNSTVYSNRAIAAAVVAQMTVHAWMSTATSTTSILWSGGIGFLLIALQELAQICCWQLQHIPHMVEAFLVMAKYFMKFSDYNDKVKDVEDKFNTAVESIKTMVDDIHQSQHQVLGNAKDNIESIPSKLKELNIPKGSNGDFARSNQKAFACALEGSKFDGDCDDDDRKVSEKAERSKVIANTANAMRPPYDQRLNIMDLHEDFKSNSDFLQDIQNNKGQGPLIMKFGSAYTGESKSMFSTKDKQSKNVGASVINTFLEPRWEDGTGSGGMPARVFSDKDNKGEHFGRWAHDGDHDKFKGVSQEDAPCKDQNCFINFRATQDEKKDFGQPTIYSSAKYATLGEKMSGQRVEKNPWMLNAQGTVELQLSSGSSATIKLIPRKPGIAISKAKTYFHQIGDWSAPPNFFDPFWRAKLHPFKTRAEAVEVAKTAGDPDGAGNAEKKVAVEGSEQ